MVSFLGSDSVIVENIYWIQAYLQIKSQKEGKVVAKIHVSIGNNCWEYKEGFRVNIFFFFQKSDQNLQVNFSVRQFCNDRLQQGIETWD